MVEKCRDSTGKIELAYIQINWVKFLYIGLIFALICDVLWWLLPGFVHIFSYFIFELISQGLPVNISDEEQPNIEAVPNSYDPAIGVADTCQTSGPCGAV